MHYYKRHLGDYAKKAGRLSMLEHGAYTLLIDSCYDRERFPTKEEAIKWCWARSGEEVAAVEFVLDQFFEFDGDRYTQTRIQEEIDSYHEKANTNKRIALEREEQRRSKRTRTEHEPCTDEHEPPPNHKPLTTNQEPKEQVLKSSSDDSCSPKKGKVTLSKLECQQIADHYNDKLGDKLPRVALMSEKRMRLINARFQEMLNTIGANKEVRFTDKESGIAWFGRLFYKATMRGAFYFGDNDRGWTATFDWLLSPKAFTDLIESDPRKKE